MLDILKLASGVMAFRLGPCVDRVKGLSTYCAHRAQCGVCKKELLRKCQATQIEMLLCGRGPHKTGIAALVRHQHVCLKQYKQTKQINHKKCLHMLRRMFRTKRISRLCRRTLCSHSPASLVHRPLQGAQLSKRFGALVNSIVVIRQRQSKTAWPLLLGTKS